MAETDPSCEGCAHWRLLTPATLTASVNVGRCLRFPPALGSGYNTAINPDYWVWPITKATSVCGEHEPMTFA